MTKSAIGMDIGEMNRRITFKSWGSSQDEGGGAIAVLLSSYIIWAKVEPRSGQPYQGQQQAVWNYDYKVTFRYEISRVISSNYTIDYDSKRLSINSVSYLDEGNRKYAIAKCTTIDSSVDTTQDLIAAIGTYNYTGIGGEDYFSSGLTGTTIIGAFKDGIEFQVLLSGTPTGKQVVYNSGTGVFLWGIPFEPGENAMIQYYGTSSTDTVEEDSILSETPAGVIDGSTATFTTAYNFIPGKVSVYVNGLLQKMVTHYNTSGTNTIIFTDSPHVGDSVEVDYIKQA